MRMLSGTAVWVDNTLNEMQVDLSPHQHLSLPSQSLIQRQPKRMWAYCVLCMQLSTCTLRLAPDPRAPPFVPLVCVCTYRPLVLLYVSAEGLPPDSSRCSGRSQHESDLGRGLSTCNKTKRQTNSEIENY